MISANRVLIYFARKGTSIFNNFSIAMEKHCSLHIMEHSLNDRNKVKLACMFYIRSISLYPGVKDLYEDLRVLHIQNPNFKD